MNPRDDERMAAAHGKADLLRTLTTDWDRALEEALQ